MIHVYWNHHMHLDQALIWRSKCFVLFQHSLVFCSCILRSMLRYNWVKCLPLKQTSAFELIRIDEISAWESYCRLLISSQAKQTLLCVHVRHFRIAINSWFRFGKRLMAKHFGAEKCFLWPVNIFVNWDFFPKFFVKINLKID